MTMCLLNRRDALRLGTSAAVAMALGGAAGAAQFGPPEALGDERISFVATTADKWWVESPTYKPAFRFELLNLNVSAQALERAAKSVDAIEGFGACLNERGWVALNALGEKDKEAVFSELFDPHAGGRFTYCRMPIGANDFAREAYSYDEVDGDFEMKHFSIGHDRDSLIPFIHEAQKYQPKLKLWASPWSPPTWMKRNHFYAEAKAFAGMKENGIRPDQVGHEGEDMFIQEPKYFEAYARYFARFIEAYRAEKIEIGMVMPQNEFNSAQNFPSCTWTPGGLARFIEHLGPEMQKLGVEVFFGTLERGDVKLLDTVMNDPAAARWVKGVGAQWAGKGALADIEREYPELAIFSSEQECGDGTNSWSYTSYCWELLKEYFRRGARAHMYWNLATPKGGMSTWGWAQNSLVSVDMEAKAYTLNNDYFLLKHLTHFVEVGAKRVDSTGTCDDSLCFVNPDGSFVALVRNVLAHAMLVTVQVGARAVMVEMPADSVGTVRVKS